MSNRFTPRRIRFLMGLGLDSDGHARVTRGDDFLLLGGSEATHETMQEHVERFHDTLEKMGTDLQNASEDQMLDAAGESGLLSD